MKAQPLFNRRVQVAETEFAELVAWTVPTSVPGSRHPYKYRLAFVVNGVCVLRYDNEAGKGDHRHWGDMETAYAFTGVNALIADFLNDVTRWRDEHSNA